jgi:RNA polymerase sigma-70 factor (ECF subfamily)
LTLPQMLSDQESNFIERLRAGELGAVAELYEQHQAALCSFARHLLAESQAAEDLVHDVFVAFPRLAHKFQPGKSLRGFLLSIAANRAHHYLRAAGRRRRIEDSFARQPMLARVELPDQRLERTRLAMVLAQALEQVSLPQRLALVLCEVEELGSREAAEILNVPEGTVRTRVHHAKKRIKNWLEKEGLP